MADFDQLPKMLALRYCLNKDVPVTNPRKTNHYVKEIASAIERLELFRIYIASEKWGSSVIYIELAHSIHHYLQIFKTLIMAINNSSDRAMLAFNNIKKNEQKINDLILSKNKTNNGNEVPCISPYKLAIQIIIDNCKRAKEAKSVKDLMS